METINQPGMKGICFGCYANALPKTGRTVVVKSETGDLTQPKGPITGRVEMAEVPHAPSNVKEKPMNEEPVGVVVIKMTIDELSKPDLLWTVLNAIYNGIDEMPPFKTLKETKRAIRIQENITEELHKLRKEPTDVGTNQSELRGPVGA
jgi:hypothetical protein